MSRNDADWEYQALTTDLGRSLLDEATHLNQPGPADFERLRKRAPAELVAAAFRLADCRRRARAKFAWADRMWLTQTSLEQATSERVARHKAARFAGRTAFDLCSGVGGDAIALASAGSPVLAADLDADMGRRLRWNAGVYGVSESILAVRSPAERLLIPREALVHIDPDRRASGKARARAIADYQPGLATLYRLAADAPGGAIKLSPGSDFEAHFGTEPWEVEITILDGECKEATVWFGCLATCRRRATTLDRNASWTDRDETSGAKPSIAPIGAFLFDPDPALTRSGLLDPFALAHGLSKLGPGVSLLTGDSAIESPFLTAFEVQEILPPDRKQLRRAIARRAIGRLDIKTQGVDLRPETLRAELRPEGPHAATLILYRTPLGTRAVLARRVGWVDASSSTRNPPCQPID